MRHIDLMNLRIPRYVALAACLSALVPREARAWNRDGHRIVCRIAWQLLDQARRTEIERLTSAYRDPDGQPVGPFWDACSFPDDARAKARSAPAWHRFAVFETWHFANVPRTTTRLPSPPCLVPCVISAVEAHTDSLRRVADDASRAEALFFLSHWVADLHQPLHVSFQDDRGGNQVSLVSSGYYSAPNMHALWDGGLLSRMKRGMNWQDLADRLAHDMTPARRATWIQGTPVDWAQESYNLITSPEAQYCDWQVRNELDACVSRAGARTLGHDYQLAFSDDVALRLQQAGVRLAEVLRASLPVSR